MSSDEEVAALRRMVEFEAGEELLAIREGSVTAPGVIDRQGILFLTHKRVGVSAAAGFFTEDACFFLPVWQITSISANASLLTIEGPSPIHLVAQEGVGLLRDEIDHVRNRWVRDGLDDLHAEAESALKGEDWKAAKAASERLLVQQPSCIPAQINLALACTGLGENATAISAVQGAISAGPPAEQTRALKIWLAELAVDAEELAVAIEVATQVLDEAPSGAAYKYRGIARMKLDDYSSGLSDLRRAVEVAPEDAHAWYVLGILAFNAKDLPTLAQAIAELEKLEVPAAFRVLRAGSLLLEKRYADALDEAEAALDAGSSDYFAAKTLLDAASKVDPSRGLARLPALDEHHKDDFEYAIYVADLLVAARRCGDAWHRIQRVDAPDSEILNALKALFQGLALVESGRFDEAHVVVRACLDQGDPAWSPPWVTSESDNETFVALVMINGWALVESGRAAQALPFLQRAESCGDLGYRWLNEKLREVVEKAHREAATKLSAAPGAKVGTYELLSKAADALRASGRLDGLAKRMESERFSFDEPPVVAVMGEYSVGKSSFINALLRQTLLPAGEGVTTGTVTVLRYGEDERMRAVFDNGRVAEQAGLASVSKFVTETGAGSTADDLPHHVDVFLRSDALKRVRIVDSPGLNAPFKKHKEITEAFLDEADAVVWLFNVENAGRVTEKEFLDKVKAHRRKAVAVVNQVDLVTPAEATDAISYVKEVFPDTFANVFGVSAKVGLDAAQKGDDTLREKSGLGGLERWLDGNLLRAAREIKEQATKQKVLEALAEVPKEREKFDAMVEEAAAAVRNARGQALTLVRETLRAAFEAHRSALRAGVQQAITEAARAICERSGPEAPAPIAALEPISLTFRASCGKVWDDLVGALVPTYREGAKALRETLDAIDRPEWRGVLSVSLHEFDLNLRSWEKDLRDYMEQVSSFLQGYTEARGLAAVQQLDLGPKERNDASKLEALMKSRLPFLWERADAAVNRWFGELEKNLGEDLARLERGIRTEAVGIRERSYRRVERLGRTLDGSEKLPNLPVPFARPATAAVTGTTRLGSGAEERASPALGAHGATPDQNVAAPETSGQPGGHGLPTRTHLADVHIGQATIAAPPDATSAGRPRAPARTAHGISERRFATVGRAPDSGIAVPLDGVSWQHGYLHKIGSDWLIEDAGSTNGTWVRGVKLSRMVRVPVMCGEEVFLGNHPLVVPREMPPTARTVATSSLRAHMDQVGPMPLADVLEVLWQVSEVLTNLQAAGYCLPTLAPDTIYLSPGRVEMNTTFVVGCPSPLEWAFEPTDAGPEYSAPELYAYTNGRRSPRTDVYSLAVMAYEMLTSTLPIEAASPSTWAEAHRTQAPRALSRTVGAAIPQTTVEVIMAGLQKDPVRRYASPQLFMEALWEAGSDQAVAAAREPAPNRPVALPPPAEPGPGPTQTGPTGGPNDTLTRHRQMLKIDPTRADSYRAIYDFYLQREAWDEVWCCAAVLVFLDQANDEQRRFFADWRATDIPKVAARLTTELWWNHLFDEEQDKNLGKIYEGVALAALKLRINESSAKNPLPVCPQQFRQDPGSSKVQFARTFWWAADALGLRPPILYARADLPGGLVAVASEPPSSIAGQGVLSGLSILGGAFVAGRHLSMYRGEHYIRTLFPTIEGLLGVLYAAVYLVSPVAPLPQEVALQARATAESLARFMAPQQREWLKVAVSKFLQDGARADVGRWAKCVETTAARAGLLLCGDIAVAWEGLQASERLPGDVSPDARLRDLMPFCVSDSYFNLRKVLGMAIQTDAPPPDAQPSLKSSPRLATASPAYARAALTGDPGIFIITKLKEAVVGRDVNACEIILNESRVSSVHARLRLDAGVLQVRDEGSTNGTYINDIRIPSHVWSSVSQGAVLNFGPIAFTVQLE